MQYSEGQSALQVIKAKNDQGDVLAELEANCFAIPWSLADCSAELHHAQVLILCINGRPAGYASLGDSGEQAELRRIAIEPQWRAKGYGRRLLAAMIDLARACGYRECLLEVSEKNVAALSLYASAGFSEYHRRKQYYPDGSTAICMRLLLSPELGRQY